MYSIETCFSAGQHLTAVAMSSAALFAQRVF
jgi:hypothetical protein